VTAKTMLLANGEGVFKNYFYLVALSESSAEGNLFKYTKITYYDISFVSCE